MYSFIGSIIALVLGYFIYGKFVEGVFGIDPSKATPAERLADGVDYIFYNSTFSCYFKFINSYSFTSS